MRMPQASTDREATVAVEALLAWFAAEARPWPWRRSRDRWVVLVAEVCLQQTQVMRAAPHIERILERFPTAGALAGAPLSELLELWTGLGYPRRARNLWLAAGIIDSDGWPRDFRDLPGVGDYTAAALACFADEQPVLPLDINTRRVSGRLFPGGVPAVEHDPWQWGQALMELGQRVCRARAWCEQCPVQRVCPSRGTDEVVASPRQQRYEGSLRQRRGDLLRAVTRNGAAPIERDVEAARTLLADGLVGQCGDDVVSLSVERSPGGAANADAG